MVAAALACRADKTFIVEGTVREVVSPTEIVVDHEAIAGFMGPMVMPFHLASAEVGAGVRPGDRIYARLVVAEEGAWLEKLRVVGHDPTAEAAPALPEATLAPGGALARVEVVTPQGPWAIGEGQGGPTLVTFLYTTCPMPEFCPATARRLQELQARLQAFNPAGARLVAVTIDPAGDTLDALGRYGAAVGADPAVWRLGRVEGPAYARLLASAGLRVADDKAEHTLRTLVLDAGGRLVARYDDNAFPADEVLRQLGSR